MDSKGREIAYQVAYKAAVELVASGKAEFETDDIGSEIAALADLLYQPLEHRLTQIGGETPTQSSSPSGSSSRPSGQYRGSNGDGATDKQIAFIKKLAVQRDHNLGFVSVDGLSKSQAKNTIDQLLSFPEK